MPRYMLDTNTCSYIMKRSNAQVLKRLDKVVEGTPKVHAFEVSNSTWHKIAAGS